MTTSEATTKGGQRGERWEGTFDRCLNWKITLSKLNDDSSTNDQWIWLPDVQRYINSGCSMDILESEIDRSLSNRFWGVWFCQNQMLGDTVEMALEKMKQTDQSQHSDGLLQAFYAKAQRNGEPIGKYAVRLDLAAGKVQLQSCEALGSTKAERSRLLVDRLLLSMNPKLRARVAHVVDGKDPRDRPSYYKLVKFSIQKEAEIDFDEAKKTRDSNSKPKATSHFHYAGNLLCLSPQQFAW